MNPLYVFNFKYWENKVCFSASCKNKVRMFTIVAALDIIVNSIVSTDIIHHQLMFWSKSPRIDNSFVDSGSVTKLSLLVFHIFYTGVNVS